MELIIQQKETKQAEGFTVRVDTERKDFKVGDILCIRTTGFYDHQKNDGSYHIPPTWHLYKIKTPLMAKFHRIVSYTYKVLEIC